MKKILFFLLLFLTLSGCHHVRCAEKPQNILAATFPVWIFTANICHEVPGLKVELLIPASAGCPHDFALRPADLQKLSQAQTIVINGAGLEEFLAKPLTELQKRPNIIDASAGLPLLDGEHYSTINPHVFASPGEAAKMVRNIARALASQYPDLKGALLANAEAYSQKLEAISNRLIALGQKAPNKNIAIEHDALAYLATNAGLNIIAEVEPGSSPAVLARIRSTLAQTPPALLAGDAQYADRMLKNLAEELKLPFAILDPCASGPDHASPDYYEKVMLENLKALEKYFE